MKRTSNRILSVALSVALAGSLFGAPAIASATEGDAAAPQGDQAAASAEETADQGTAGDAPEQEGADAGMGQAAPSEADQQDQAVPVPTVSAASLEDLVATAADDQANNVDPGNTGVNGAKSSVMVTVHYDFPYEGADPLAFTLTLKDETAQKERSYPITLEGAAGAFKATHELTPFGDKMLVDGHDYSLTLTGDKFITYSQEKFSYDGDTDMAVEIYAGGVELDGFNKDEKPGIMQAGNLTNKADGATPVDNADVRVLLNALEGDTAQDADLNGDGKADLADYQLMAEFYRYVSAQAAVRGATTIKTPVDTQGTAANDNTWVTKNGDNACVASRDGEEVSPQNEISVQYAMPAGAASASTAVTVGVPAATDTNNIEGYATVEGELLDAAGNPTGQTVTETYDFSSAGAEAALASEAQRSAAVGSALRAPRTLGSATQLTDAIAAARSVGDPLAPAVAEDGRITINFGKRIAIKTVTLTFTRAQVFDEEKQLISANLVEISSVEFLNNMEEHVAEPEFTKTELLPGECGAGNKEFTVVWKRIPNVTGYELLVTDTTDPARPTQTYNVGNTAADKVSKTVTSFAAGPKGKVANKVDYSVQVRPTNGSWRGEWTDTITLRPMATKVPTKPENVTATGGYRMFKVSWKAAEEADTYTLYYREGTSGDYLKIEGIEGLNYTVSGLPDRATSYQLYLTATNEIGEGPQSSSATVKTTTLTAVNLPNYMLLNTQKGADATSPAGYTANIKSARFASSGTAIEDPNGVNTSASNAWCLFDGDFKSYAQVNDWDLGTSYNRDRHGVDVAFTQPQQIGMISFAASAENLEYSGVKVFYKTADAPNAWKTAPASILTRQANDNRTYTIIKLDEGITCTEVLIGVNRYVRLINIAEMRFHGYNDIEARIASMYDEDDELADLRIKLGDAVEDTKAYDVAATTWYKEAASGQRSFQELVDNLRKELNEYKSNGEEYPFKASALTELKYVEQLLKDETAGMKEVVKVHSDLGDAYDRGRALNISGLNAWQPLGVSVSAGEKITVYAGAPKGSNTATKVDLYLGQYEGESNQAPRRIGTFRTGRTEMTLQADLFASLNKKEHGGQLYAVYTGNNVNDRYYVRVLGGDKLSRLDLLNVPADQQDAAIDQYVKDLEVQMASLSQTHAAAKAEGRHSAAGDNLNGKCVADATDIMMGKMMYSVPASTIYNAAVKGKTAVEAREALKTAVAGCEQMIGLFYQHKGLIDGGQGSNATPNRHLNIRYMEMFSGAFMYAAGNHIGVQYGNTASLLMLKEFDANGAGGKYLGWGSAHEIGHNINDGNYAFAEVTNNYFAQICKSLNENGATRWNYRSVYDQVTSGAEAHAGGQATQLAMYWQLMLAYDKVPVHTLFTSEADLLANRFFAKVDSYSRNPGSFKGSVALTLSTEQQNIIRLSCAAAGKDVTGFFEAWGFHADATTEAFAKQFGQTETRAIQYINDGLAARNADSLPAIPAGTAADALMDVALAPNADNGSIMEGTITPKASADAIHGFEVTRVSYEMGNEVRRVVAFVTADTNGAYTFADDASALGNRAVRYEVCAVDKQLNRSAVKKTDARMLEGSGRYATDAWDVTTNMTSPADAGDVIVDSTMTEQGGNTGCSGFDDDTAADPDAKTVKAINGILSGDGYAGTTTSGDPQVTIDMQAVKAVEHLVYVPKAPKNITALKVELSQDGTQWVAPAGDELVYNEAGTEAKIFFPKRQNVVEKAADGDDVDYINTEDARYIRLTAQGKGAAEWGIGQVQVFGPSGDKISLAETTGPNKIPAVGKLSEDYVLEKDAQGAVTAKIPKGSIVFVGEFKGNPAYSNVILFGTTSNGTMIIGGTTTDADGNEQLVAKQAILAPDPGNAALGETTSGSWVYWIENASGLEDGMTVRAELYRVDNAFTNQGQRLTSDSLPITISSVAGLPSITLTDNVDTGITNKTVAL